MEKRKNHIVLVVAINQSYHVRNVKNKLFILMNYC